MSVLAQPRLVNQPFGDPGVIVDFRFGSRAILFDLGDLAALSPREILRVSHIFVSHMHMDHFAGFDRLLRLWLYRDKRVHLIGPPGLVDAVDAKLRAYTWNLLDEASADFVITASDWFEDGWAAHARFRARASFARENNTWPQATLPLDEPEFHVEAATLDHGIPSLAFAFAEKMRVNVHRARLDELGLPVGPWLTKAKNAVRSGAYEDLAFEPASGRRTKLRDLFEAGVLRRARGQRIVYATDLAFHDENVARLCDLARGADQLFIEGGFLHEDRDLAAAKKHLTAAQAGEIARLAGAKMAHQMHLSPRYADREADLRDEFRRSFLGPKY